MFFFALSDLQTYALTLKSVCQLSIEIWSKVYFVKNNMVVIYNFADKTIFQSLIDSDIDVVSKIDSFI